VGISRRAPTGSPGVNQVTRLLDKLAANQVAIGSLDTLGSVRLAEVMACAGLDMILIDQMFCATDWETVYGIVRVARNYNMDTMVRVAGFPWLNRTDHRMAVDATRVLGVGATGVMASCATVEEVQELVEVSKDWHRDIHIHPFGDDDFAVYEEKVASECIVMPMIESSTSIERIDEILAVPGLKAISLGITDVSRMLGHPFEYEHPEVQAFIDSTIATAAKYSVAVGGNVGYAYSRSIDDMAARIERMTNHGFKFIWLQNNGFVVQWMYRSLIQALKPGAGSRSQTKGEQRGRG
jgi:2-keto-3-deoxy-L-rhamnonate aldolase RhmA